MRGRVTRWVGLGLMALAALTMIAGDALAAAPKASFTLRFDLLSPQPIACTADAPSAVVRSDRDLTGRPILHVTGDLTGARITCTGPDGARWATDLPRDSREPLATAIDGLALWRVGAVRIPLLVRADHDRYTPFERHSFTRLP